ncbi:MAG: hypothetical protein ACRDNK_00570 [Solirubrobacteraceae bacterium]
MALRRPRRIAAVLVGLCLPLVNVAVTAPAARAAFPGRDGLIATDNSDQACTGSCDDSGGPGNAVFTVTPQAGHVSNVTSGSVDAQAIAPSWSPDGQSLVVFQFAFALSSPALAITDLSGGSPRTVPLPAGLNPPGGAVFTPDGAHLLFAGSDARGSDLFRIGLDGSGFTRLTNIHARGAFGSPVESSRGQIAFVRAGFIYLLGHAGRAKRLHAGGQPDFSPGGTHLVFVTGGGRLIETIKVNGRGLRRLKHLRPADTCGFSVGAKPVYSPSGKYIAFTRAGNCGRPPAALVVMRADGTHSRVVLTDDPVQRPSWQPRPASAHP